MDALAEVLKRRDLAGSLRTGRLHLPVVGQDDKRNGARSNVLTRDGRVLEDAALNHRHNLRATAAQAARREYITDFVEHSSALNSQIIQLHF